MAKIHKQTATDRIFDNILFIAEVFAEKPDKEIPDVPVLELAQCFELSPPRLARMTRRRFKPWPLWE